MVFNRVFFFFLIEFQNCTVCLTDFVGWTKISILINLVHRPTFMRIKMLISLIVGVVIVLQHGLWRQNRKETKSIIIFTIPIVRISHNCEGWMIFFFAPRPSRVRCLSFGKTDRWADDYSDRSANKKHVIIIIIIYAIIKNPRRIRISTRNFTIGIYFNPFLSRPFWSIYLFMI